MTTNYSFCINRQCKVADKCSHALKYRNSDAISSETINVINPAIMNFDEAGKCQFYIEPRIITVANGMLKSTGNMPLNVYKSFSKMMQQQWNHTDYFDRRAGRKPMMPQHQQEVLDTAAELNYTFPGSPWDDTTAEIQYYY